MKCNKCGAYSSSSSRCLDCGSNLPYFRTANTYPLPSEEYFKEKLKHLCDMYDKTYGMRPESDYEGAAIYDFYQDLQDMLGES